MTRFAFVRIQYRRNFFLEKERTYPLEIVCLDVTICVAIARHLRMNVVVVGGGFTGIAVARHIHAREPHAGHSRVIATTRSAARVAALRDAGVVPLVAATLTPDLLAAHVDDATAVVITMPPDGRTDRAVAPLLARAAVVAYVSSTGVYGDASGRVNEETSVSNASARSRARLDAEHIWRDAGATIVRAPAIYGPGRGLHLRLARGEVRLAGDGQNAISRIHVDDLAQAIGAILVRHVRGGLFVVGDNEPAPHVDVVRFLCDALGLALPPFSPGTEADETLRYDRRVDPSRSAHELGFAPRYPTYREGYSHCIAIDRRSLDDAVDARRMRV
jgi:nucleoside-diphosphate-sugar epimerase